MASFLSGDADIAQDYAISREVSATPRPTRAMHSGLPLSARRLDRRQPIGWLGLLSRFEGCTQSGREDYVDRACPDASAVHRYFNSPRYGENATVCALHRGTRTFAPKEAALSILKTADGLSHETTGGFFAYDGSKVAW
jgi:hypothetical protein